MDLKIFADTNLFNAGTSFFKQLNISLNSNTTTSLHLKDILKDKFKSQEIFEKVSATYFLGLVDKSVFDDNLSLFEDEKLSYEQADKKIHADYEGMMIFAVQIDGIDLPTRTQLADLTRAFNRASQSLPVVVLFQYGDFLTLATSERTKYKQTWREGEKIGKISLLKDIDTLKPHTGHIKILKGLALEPDVRDFNGLDQQWREVFDVQLLNRNFYKELSAWYFWALRQVEFPDDAEKNKEIRNSTSVIRLITRLIFVWFLKEKRLVPEILFNKKALDTYLKYDDIKNSTYYKAILQNLFFATLNTKMKKDDKESRKFVNRQYGVQAFYRYERFFKDKKKALNLFEAIPFLNGGLFENLDKKIGKDDEIRIDCFTNSPKKSERLKVPDFLFFGDKIQIDLSKELGNKKRKKETVRGLIHILNSYKFTIDENTPIEEEIALDPELLGKVFENLLASYNPETQTTARKQTGSFYTPREIVNYMVDESLIAYHEGKLIELYEKEAGFTQKTPPSQKNMFGKQKPVQRKIAPSEPKISAEVKKEINNKLHHLLSYSSEDHLFSNKEVKTIITALDNSKILDPACGSGAFPMGILHKMVYILSRLDPQNKQWKQRQIEKQTRQINEDISYAKKINDEKARRKALDELEERLVAINDAFDNNELDYGRKLYLIENCIFGVDIQPIAVQIAKLRFFISLIVDQKTDEDKENLGILPLPNLETRFVAANTLIGIEKGLGNLFELKIKEKEKELAKVRQKHFSARTPATKAKCREKDEQLRAELAQLLRKNGDFGTGVAEKLAHWDPYDQNTSADFFDMEWMFGVKDGFDVVIGNPPYVNAKALTIHFKNLREKLTNSDEYRTLYKKWDLYIPFVEKGINISRQNGITCMIIPYPFINQTYSKLLRKYVLNNFTLMEIVDLSNTKVFDATVLNCICIISKSKSERKISISSSENNIIKKKFLKKKEDIIIDHKNYIWDLKDTKRINIKHDKLKVIGDFAFLSIGMVLNANEKIAKGQFTKKDLISDERTNKHIKKYVEAKNLDKFEINKIRWLEWNTARVPKLIRRPTFPELYDNPKLLINKIGEIKVAFDKDNISCDQTVRILVLWKYLKGVQNKSINNSLKKFYNEPRNILEKNSENISYNYILCILNSKLGDYLLSRIRGAGNIDINPEYLKNIPIPQISLAEQHPFIKLADEIITAKKSKLLCDTTALEAEIDARVAHLYNLTEEEYSLILKETNCPDPFRVAALNVYRDIARGKIK